MTLKKNLTILSMGAALLAVVACSSDDSGGGDGDGDGDGSGGSNNGSGGNASGGSNGGDGDGDGGTNGDGDGDGDDVCAPFADFESNDNGFWMRLNDNAVAGTLTPAATFPPTSGVSVDPSNGANGSTSSIHYEGTGFTYTDPAGGPTGVNIANDLTADDCKDASDYTGISLYAYGTVAADTGSFMIAENQIIVFVGDGTAEMSYRAALDTAKWGQIKLAFDDAGWYNPDMVDVSKIAYVKVLIGGATFDVHLDEIGYYK